MSNVSPSPRRLSTAISVAVASVTIAVVVTAGSLAGWFRPSADQASQALPTENVPAAVPAAAPASTPVILVPVAPEVPAAPAPAPSIDPGDYEPQVAVHERRHHDDDDDEREDEHDDD